MQQKCKNTDSEKPESDAADVAAASKADVKERKSDFNPKKRAFGIYESARVLQLQLWNTKGMQRLSAFLNKTSHCSIL